MSDWCEVARRQRRYDKKSQGCRAQSGQRAPECSARQLLRAVVDPTRFDHWLVIVVLCRLEVFALRLSCEGSSDRDRDTGFGCIASCVPSPVCGSVWSLCLRAPIMHEWLNDGQKMMICSLVIERTAVTPRTRLEFICREISALMRHMTRRIFWQVVMPDMAQLPGPAEPTDMAAGLGRPQQERLIADPPPFEQPRALQRKSPSGYAWQVEVAAGELVMAASKLTCKELSAGA